MAREGQELRARKVLAEHERIVLDEIERKRKHAAYDLCLRQTSTNAITIKSSQLTRKAVTGELEESFRRELVHLEFRHVEVELEEAGGEKGVLYHRLVLKRAPRVELPNVVSEVGATGTRPPSSQISEDTQPPGETAADCLRDAGLCERFAKQTLEFLDLTIEGGPQYPPSDLRENLRAIRSSDPKLESDRRFRRLRDYLRKFGIELD